MKIGNKLIIGFAVIASLVGLVGIFSVISHNNIQTNSKIITEVLELGILLDESLVKLLALNQTENIKDYVREKSDYEQIRAEFDALFKKLDEENEKQLQNLGFNIEAFHKDADELAKISNRLIALHKRELAKNKASKEKKRLEKELRHKTQDTLFALQDNALTRDVELMQYKSKEALYQYKDQRHCIEWLDSISKIKDNSLVVPSQDISKDLNAYERVAQDLSKIIVEQETIETRKHLAFRELQELINLLEENNKRIANKVKTESQALARNTQLIMFAVVVAAFLVSIILGLTIARSISKPVTKLAQTTQAIAQGDFSLRVDIATDDEIGELAASFNEMAAKLKESYAHLEQKVKERTAELTSANTKLEEEITERKHAEEALEISNRELTDFVFIASHDLREPLRKISSFGEMLEDSLEGKLKGDDKENLEFMVDGANRMTEMIEGLVLYSRVSTKEAPFKMLDLNEIVKQVQELELAVMLEETGGTIEVPQPLPRVEGNLIQIRQLLQNLIANGIRYREDEVRPRIVIRAKQIDNDKVRIEVQDNGIGVKQEYHNEIFTMFRRLHSRQKYEGAGIGLAVCRKIVDRHGGQIGVDSKEGEGSTFWFTLSPAEEAVAVA